MGSFCSTSRQRGGKISIDATLIATVYNESESIDELVESIKKQTQMPDEVIIVDGGSTDGTWEKLQNYEKNMNRLKVLRKEGCNIAEGRNIAVESSSNDYIASTDGGCILDRKWFEKITDKFEEGNEYVIGMFKPQDGTLFQQVQGTIVCSPHTVEELQKGNRGPSSRSVGFSKQAWKDAGGYPEELYTGEDSHFNAKVMAAGYKPAIAQDALVYWQMRPDWHSFFKQFYRYGNGDAKGGNLFIHPSQKLGISKNLWLLSSQITTLILFAYTISALLSSRYLSPSVSFSLLILFSSLPTLYYISPLRTVTKNTGLNGLLIGIGITQLKSWAYFLGFCTELVKHPSLFIKQFAQLQKFRGK